MNTNSMKIEQIYTGCLAQGAYYIESEGEAAIVDPLRESKPYIDRANKHQSHIKYIFETHFHADFVSGHVDLANKTGATIVYGPQANPSFDFHSAIDGEEFQLGKLTIRVLHTPGHTMESTTYLLLDEKGDEYAIFSGDTLFIGDVGRPDLAQKGDLTQDDLAGYLYDSLRSKIMPLPNEVIVYPAHGAGSACGKNMSKETSDTLGSQKQTNYALRVDMTKEEFIKEVTDGLLPPPQYFAKNVAMNKSETAGLDEILKTGHVALEVDTFEALAKYEGTLILDTRSKEAFVKSHIPGSIFIGLDGSFAPWVGALITDLQQPIIFLAEEGREVEVVTRLSRVGYDNTLGYLEGGIAAWIAAHKDYDHLESISADQFVSEYQNEPHVLDVRKPTEFNLKHVDRAVNAPLDHLNDQIDGLSDKLKYFVYCQSGYRSLIAGSILKARGIHNLVNVEGGIKAISETSVPVTDQVHPSTTA